MATRIIIGDALEVLKQLPSNLFHCIVTSPPYWNLRDYNITGQIGLEKSFYCLFDLDKTIRGLTSPITPNALQQLLEGCGQCYICKLRRVFKEAQRVLRHDGTLWLNIGDTYHNKQLLSVPSLLVGALKRDGWILRADVIWEKSNPMPDPVKDRPTISHEYIFLLTKSTHYFYNQDAIREPLLGKSDKTLGRNKRSVWKFSTSRFEGSHFATFPPQLAELCLKAGTTKYGVCGICGTPYKIEKVLSKSHWEERKAKGESTRKGLQGVSGSDFHPRSIIESAVVKGCDCPPGYKKKPLILDMFGGAGTTSLVGERLFLDSVFIELNPNYAKIAYDRIKKDSGLFANITIGNYDQSKFSQFLSKRIRLPKILT